MQVRLLVFCGLMLNTSCDALEGLGPGPYSAANSPEDCSERMQPVFVEQRDLRTGKITPGFCTSPCESSPDLCPLRGYLAKTTPEVAMACVSNQRGDSPSVCALIPADDPKDPGRCPEGMQSIDLGEVVSCYIE